MWRIASRNVKVKAKSVSVKTNKTLLHRPLGVYKKKYKFVVIVGEKGPAL